MIKNPHQTWTRTAYWFLLLCSGRKNLTWMLHWWYLQCCHVTIWPVWLKYTKNKVSVRLAPASRIKHRGGEADDAFGFLICYEIQKECLCAHMHRGTLWLMPTSPIRSQTAYLTLWLSHRACANIQNQDAQTSSLFAATNYFKQAWPSGRYLESGIKPLRLTVTPPAPSPLWCHLLPLPQITS